MTQNQLASLLSTPKRRINVLMLTWEYPPRIVGGISTHVYNITNRLVKRGVSVKVITCSFPNAPPEEVVDGVHVIRVENSRLLEANFLLWIYNLNSQMIKKGRELLNEELFDLVHAHDWVVGRAAIELKNLSGLPLISTIHATEVGRGGRLDGDYRRKVRDIELLLTHQSDRIICCSEYMVRHVRKELDAPNSKIDLIPNGVDISKFDLAPLPGHARTVLPLTEGDKVVLYVGRMVREKGIFTLLDAFGEVRRQLSGVKLVFAGDGPLREDLEREILRRGLSGDVCLMGFVDDRTLLSLYKLSNVFVLPSHYEPFGIVALEAIASRTPVVVSDVGGLSEIVEDGVTGLKVPPSDPTALALAIVRLLKDPVFSESLMQNAYRSIQEKYSWEQIADKTLQTYDRVFARPPSVVKTDAEEFLADRAVLTFLLTIGATDKNNAKSSKDIASLIEAPETPVKQILGRHASRGYVLTAIDNDSSEVRYHLTGTGIIKACSEFS